MAFASGYIDRVERLGEFLPAGNQHHRDRRERSGVIRLRSQARSINRIADIVENEWASLSPDFKTVVKSFAYDSDTPVSPGRWVLRLPALTRLYVDFLRDPDAVFDYVAAVERLREAVFSAVEAECESLQSDLADALGGLDLDADGTSIEPGREREYLAGL